MTTPWPDGGASPPPPPRRVPPPPKRGQVPALRGIRPDDPDRRLRIVATVVIALTVPIWLVLFGLVLLSYAPDDAPLAHTAFWTYPVFLGVGMIGSWALARRGQQRTLSLALLALPLIGTAFWFGAFVDLAANGA